MRHKLLTLFLLAFFAFSANAQNAWINEIHYDNDGGDVGEAIEIVIEDTDGTYTSTLSDFTLTLYNGSNGESYGSETADNMTAGAVVGNYYFFVWTPSSIQNGAPDGISLDYQGTIIQFLSYEGDFTATNGPASGETSVDIGVSQSGGDPIGESLQLSGTGLQYSDFTWQGSATGTFGLINNDQNFGEVVLEEIDWCNLQWPENGTIDQGGTFDVYAQVWEDGVTTGGGQGAGITAWIGISTEDTDPSTWTTWIPATYNGDSGNNDEYTAEIGSSLPAGTYYYAARFQIDGGPYSYGGYNAGGGGFWDGTNNVSGMLTVNFVPQIVSVPYTRDFETGDLYTDGWTTQILVGTMDWQLGDYGGDHFAEMSNYDGGNSAAETWLITPGIDLTGTTNPVFNFMNASNYSGNDIEIYVSDSYDGESVPNIADWTQVTANLSTGGFADVFSGDIDLSSYIGSTIYVAFRYVGTDSDGKTWQIDDFNVIDALPATQLSISNVSPASPYTGQAFNVTVQSLDQNGDLASVDQDTEVQINLASGTGSFTMTYTGTISSGTDEVTVSGLTYDVAETIEINASANSGMMLSTSANYTMTVTTAPTIPAVFISEYIEGSSNNKAIEIYNGTGAELDLTGFSVKLGSNGGGWGNTEDLTGTLAAGDVFVIANSSADPVILSESDVTSNVTYFGGNDAIGLFYNDVLIDLIGDPDLAPANAWDVAGETEATQNHTLVRKYPDVTMGNSDWTSSAGTNTSDSEWEVYGQDEFSFIGWHGEPPTEPALSITAPTDGSTHYTSTVAVDLSVDNFVVAAGGTGDGYLSVDLNGTAVDIYTTTFSITTLPAGTYTMTVTLVDNGGNPLDPNVSDMVTFYVEEIPAVTIYDIQYTTEPSGDSPYVGQTVQTEGVVTAIKEATKDGKVVINYYIQDGTGAWNGIFVYDNNFEPAVGDLVSLTAEVVEYNGLTELSDVTEFNVLSSGNPLPAPVSLTTAEANAEDYEGVLIMVADAECTAEPNNYNEWYVNDGSGELQVDDNLFFFDPTLGSTYNITGIGHYAFSEFEIIPRNAEDITVNPDATSFPEEPAEQVAGQTLDATLVTTEEEAVEIFRFNITDAGGDGYDTYVEQMTFYAGADQTIDLENDIAGAYFMFTDNSEMIQFTSDPMVYADHVVIPVDAMTTVIPEGTSREVACYMWFETTVADDAAVQFMISTNHGFAAEESGSQFTETIETDIVGNVFILDQNISVNDISADDFKLYPNPATDMLYIAGTEKADRMEIVNVLGQTIKEMNVNSNDVQIDINSLDAGMYIVKIYAGNNVVTQSFIKQ